MRLRQAFTAWFLFILVASHPLCIHANDAGLGSSESLRRGVLYAERFNGTNVPAAWSINGIPPGKPILDSRGHPVELLRARGADGVSGSIQFNWGSAPVQARCSFPPVTVTKDLMFCVLVKNRHGSSCKFSLHGTSPCSVTFIVPKDEWRHFRIPALDFRGAVEGMTASTFSIEELRGGEIASFAIIRGEKKSQPTAPGNLTIKKDGYGIQLRWTAATDPAGVVGYRVFRSNVRAAVMHPHDLVGTTVRLVFVDRLPANSGEWWYAVVAEDHLGQFGPPAGPLAVDRK